MNMINEQKKRPPTVRDLAKLAGVSTGTISRVLNGAENLSPEIRKRTLDIIRSEGYETQPRGRRYGNQAARPRPAKASDRNILLLAPEMSPAWTGHELWMHFIAGVKRACDERSYSYLVSMSESFGEALCKLRGADRIACGAIVKTGDNPPPEEMIDAVKDVPLVGFGAYCPECAIPQISVDEYAVGSLAAKTMLSHGHERIAFVSTDSKRPIFSRRAAGYAAAMKEAGLFAPELFIDTPCAHSSKPEDAPPDMAGALRKILAAKATAAIFVNDWAALGFYRAAQTAGVRIPDDISAMGIDDSALCNVVTPALSSMAMPFEEEAYFAACTLIDMLEGAGRHLIGRATAQYLPARPLVRKSIKPAMRDA